MKTLTFLPFAQRDLQWAWMFTPCRLTPDNSLGINGMLPIIFIYRDALALETGVHHFIDYTKNNFLSIHKKRGLYNNPPCNKQKPFLIGSGLNIIVKRKLPRVRPQINLLYFIHHLVGNPGLYHIIGKNITLQEKVMVFFKCIQGVPQ